MPRRRIEKKHRGRVHRGKPKPQWVKNFLSSVVTSDHRLKCHRCPRNWFVGSLGWKFERLKSKVKDDWIVWAFCPDCKEKRNDQVR